VRRILVDIIVLLDAVLEREPHAEAAARIWTAVEIKRASGLVPAHGVTTLFYLFSRARGAAAARRSIGHLLTVFGVAAVNREVLQRALSLGWADFEDAVCAAAAEGAGCDLIVTRDAAGFRSSPVHAVDPAAALALLDRESGPDRVSERRQAAYLTGRRARPGERRSRTPRSPRP
jgi:predicted nucleic acid-binding protein